MDSVDAIYRCATCHVFCFHLFGWIKISVPNLFSLSVAWIGVLIFLVYYLYLDLVIGAAASVLLIILCAIANIFTTDGPTALNIKVFVITFILGWIFQLIGHAIEGKKSSFLRNILESVFIAPFFITAKVLFICGIKKDIEQVMEEKSIDEL